MTGRSKGFRTHVSRRDFLTLAAGGAAWVVTAGPGSQILGEASSGVQSEGAETLDTGGIAMEHFEAARKRAASMVAKLTLSEKISQFGASAAAVERVGLPAFDYYATEGLHGLLHTGPVTVFPLPMAMGCSWNRSLMLQVFSTVSDEIWAWHKKNGLDLAMFSPPTVNLGARDPRWGRIGENYSEDPCLIGQMAVYTIHGMQGNDPRYLKTITCAKHYIANGTDTDRETTSATVDPRSFWEYYSRGFEACVREGHVFTVMSSYNAMNGIPTSCSRFLLTELLRERWGFRGYVVSDCDAIGDICRTHHFVPTYEEAAALAVNAGCDINCGDTLQKYLGKAVDEMLISESILDQSLVRSFTGRILLGMFDPPEQNPYSKIPISCLESPAHQQIALEAARQSIVLFKNDNNTLPLDKSSIKKIAVIGPMANACYLGDYSGTPQFRVSPLEGIKQYLGIPASPSYQKQAADFTQMGGNLLMVGPNQGPGIVGPVANGSWLAYSKVLFTGATEFHVRAGSSNAGGDIEVRLDSLDGPLVCRLKVPNTEDWLNWVDVSAPIRSIDGEHTVFLRFVGGSKPLFSMDSFRLTPESPIAAPTHAGTEVVYALGCSVVGNKDFDQFQAAVQAAKEADVSLVFVGSDHEVTEEGNDRSDIHLPGVQHELVRAVYEANPRTILVISTNAPLAVNWEQDHLPAIVGGFALGEEEGRALADVLFGDYNPGGKTSITWYRAIDDLPDFHDYNIRHGRTYMYFKGNPLYPFGHGLSYTTFQYKNLRLGDRTLKPGGKTSLSFDVSNTGSRDGDEIVQVFVHVAGGDVVRPIKQLVNFDRLHIKAGATRTVNFELPYEERALRYWDEDKYEFVVEPGTVDIIIGASSADIKLKGQIQLA